MYLLDTNVVSELRRPRPDRNVVAWLERSSTDQLYLSAVTLGELQSGIEMTRPQDPAKAAAIESWVERLAEGYDVLPMTGAVFRQWARLMHRQPRELMEDAMIAATAQVHNLIVVTRNGRDFERLNVPHLNPFTPPAA